MAVFDAAQWMVICDLRDRLGAAQMAMAEWEAAVAALEAGIALDPASDEMVSWCGVAFLARGRTHLLKRYKR